MNKAILREYFALTDKHIPERGCGTGLNTKYLAQHARHVIGVDLSEQMLAKARQRL